MLHHDEWLEDAKKVPIGGTRRVYHGAERRPNLVVKNLEDRYTAYCHACKQGGVVTKEFVKLGSTPVTPPSMFSPDYTEPLSLAHTALVQFLHTKDMTLPMVLPHNPLWSPSDKRIVFNKPDKTIGRDVTELSKSKWFEYKSRHSYLRVNPNKIFDSSAVVVLVEDFFSGVKGDYYCPDYMFVSLTGTAMYADLIFALTKVKRVVLCLDNDQAGLYGIEAISSTLSIYDVPFSVVLPDAGADPKNMNAAWWEHNFPRL